VNKSEGQVKFNTVVVSEDCGLIQSSVIEIFTSSVTDHIVNILHLHVEDMKDEIPLEGIYMLPEQVAEEYADWTNDVMGRALRYKILVKEHHVEAVLYNTGNTTEYITFIERRINTGDLFRYGESIVEIVSIPTGMLTRSWQGVKSDCEVTYNMFGAESHCTSRHASDLPGLVDVKVVISQGEVDKQPKLTAVPICQCTELSIAEKRDVEECFRKFERDKVGIAEELVRQVEEMVQQYNKTEIRDKKAFLDEMSGLINKAKQMMEDQQELKSKHWGVIQQGDRVVRNIAMDIRFAA
jgi:hypothetical protein